MGKIIKFDPNRRRKGTRNWTRPEDYGVPPAPTPARRTKRAAPPPRYEMPTRSGGTSVRAKLAVAAIILAAVLTSLYGLS